MARRRGVARRSCEATLCTVHTTFVRFRHLATRRPARNSTMRASTRHGRPVRNVSSGQCRCTTSTGRVKRRR